MDHIQFNETVLTSKSIASLPIGARVWFPWDILAADPDAHGCFLIDPALMAFRLSRTLFKNQTEVELAVRIKLYAERYMLELWTAPDGREYGHWVSWFRPTTGAKRVNRISEGKKYNRGTPIPPSLVPYGGDPNKVKDWNKITDAVELSYRTRHGLGTPNTISTPNTNTKAKREPELEQAKLSKKANALAVRLSTAFLKAYEDSRSATYTASPRDRFIWQDVARSIREAYPKNTQAAFVGAMRDVFAVYLKKTRSEFPDAAGFSKRLDYWIKQAERSLRK